MGNKSLLLFYIFADNPYADTMFNILIADTNFTHLSYDPGSITESIMQIRLSSYINVTLIFSRVKITSNQFSTTYTGHRKATILSVGNDVSTMKDQLIRVTIEFCSLLNNTANNLLHIKGIVYLDVISSNFSNNNVNSALFITSSHDIYDFRNKIVQIV